jgi:hypothetical protein
MLFKFFIFSLKTTLYNFSCCLRWVFENRVTSVCRLCSCFHLSLMLRPMVSRPVCHGIKHPPGAYEKTFITVRQLRICWCGVLSLTRGGVCPLQLLLVFASAAIVESESRGNRDHILLSQIRLLPCRRLLRLRGLASNAMIFGCRDIRHSLNEFCISSLR